MEKVLKVAFVIAVVMAALVTIALLSTLGYSALDSSYVEPYTTIQTYYIAAVEEDWNYIPKETDLFKKRNSDNVQVPVKNEEDPLGFGHVSKRAASGDLDPLRPNYVYKKAVFREFTDETYTQQIERAPWMGILGPLVKAEVGEEIEIHFYNNASHPVSLHAHGVQYEKEHEGALYHSNSTEQDDDKVLPGQSFVYHWKIPPQRGPTEADPNCVVWAYHSHVSGDTDIHTGLIGPLMICKPGSQNGTYSISEFNKYFILLFLIFDENQSWYLNENLDSRTGNATQDEKDHIKGDENFQKSNQMYSINGYMYDNVPGLEICIGSEVEWHFIGMGNEVDIHSVTFSGHSLLVNGHRTDVVHLFPAKFSMAVMIGTHEGNWSIKSEVGDHFQAGMEAHFSVKYCEDHSSTTLQSNGFVRKYYIAVEEILWDYSPTGINKINGLPILNDSESTVFFEKLPNRIGGVYKKAVYRGYMDSEFKIPSVQSPSMGILGPTIRAEVGDTLEVNVFNKASRAFSFHSTAFVCLTCNRNAENVIMPGENQTYLWFIDENLGPSGRDPQCISWRYFSDGDSLSNSYAGLNGLLLTCRPNTLSADGLQKNMDKEFVLMFAVMDENNSPYLDDNIQSFAMDPKLVEKDDENFIESNLMHSINGLMYGNLFGLDICLNENISWHVMAFGHEVDMHVAHFQGNNFLYNGLYRNTLELFPGSHLTVTMMPDSEGKWMLECRTNDHVKGGMQTWYEVKDCGYNKSDFVLAPENKVREYFIAAVEEEWDYAPTNYHIITGQNLTDNEESKTFVVRDANHIGSKYKKFLFREFLDSTFLERKTRNVESQHLGILGPLIKAEVGDIIKIVFKNLVPIDCNINLHGLMEDKNSTQPVKFGEVKTYTWEVPKRSGPSIGGFNCTSWMYYSTVDSIKDVNSGLVGPLVICNPGILTETGSRIDLQREFSVLFTVFDENESWLLDQNIQEYCLDPENVNSEDEEFKESNQKHSINGRLYGTLEGLDGTVGETVAWYLMGLGNEIDLHTAHFHGLIFSENNDLTSRNSIRRGDVVDLFPGISHSIEMTLDSAGSWLFHCHVDDHLKAGMFALLNVKRE